MMRCLSFVLSFGGGLVGFLLLSGCGQSAPYAVEQLWDESDFATPESALYDDERDMMYVSLMDGGPIEKNGRGQIVMIDDQGQRLGSLADGLHAPKGMALYQDTLYVSDIDRIAVISVPDGQTRFVAVEGAQFLNDVEADDAGNIYVSDMLTGTLHRLQHGQDAVTTVEEVTIAHPNGLYWDGAVLFVASWGDGMRDDFTTEQAGRLYRYDPNSRVVTVASERFGNLDGIAVDDKGRMFVTDWINGGIFVVVDGKARKIQSLPSGSADLGYHHRGAFFVIPLMKDDRLLALKIKDDS